MKYSALSIIISLMVLYLTVKVNVELAETYINSDGKTRLLFGLIELVYMFKYYYWIGSALSGAFLFISYFAFEPLKIRVVAFLLLLIGVLSIFISFWKWFV